MDAHQHLGKACYEGVDAVFQERRSVLCRLHSKAETQHPICDSHTTVHSISKLLLSSVSSAQKASATYLSDHISLWFEGIRGHKNRNPLLQTEFGDPTWAPLVRKNYIWRKTSFLVFWKSISFQKLTDNGGEKRPELVETGFIDHLLKEINYPSSSDGVPSQILLPLKIHLSSTQTTLAGADEKGESPTKAWPRIVQKLKYSLQAPEVNTSTTEFSSDSFLTFALCNSELPSGSLTIRSCGLNSGGRTFFTKVCLKILAIFSASSSSKFPWHKASIYVCKFPAVHY